MQFQLNLLAFVQAVVVYEHTLYALMLIDSLHVQVEPALTTCAGMR